MLNVDFISWSLTQREPTVACRLFIIFYYFLCIALFQNTHICSSFMSVFHNGAPRRKKRGQIYMQLGPFFFSERPQAPEINTRTSPEG